MKLKIYMLIAIPITVAFIWGLFTKTWLVVICDGISGLVLSQWQSEIGNRL